EDAAERGRSGRLAAGDRLEVLNRIPLDVDRDPFLGAVLGEDLVDALANRRIGLGPPHALEVESPQPFCRAINALVAILLVALLLLARSVPVNDEPLAQMVRASRTLDDVERLLVAVRPLAQDLLPAYVAGKDGVREDGHLGSGPRNDGDEEATLGVDGA